LVRGFTWSRKGVDTKLRIKACEDYRAAASIDLEHDRASRAAGQKISVQALRIIWGKRGQIEKSFGEKTVDVWKACSKDDVDVSGKTLDAAHYVPEERSAELVQEIREFLG
jgi:haloacetate dehalogenase